MDAFPADVRGQVGRITTSPRSPRQRVRAGRRHEALRHPAVDVVEPVLER